VIEQERQETEGGIQPELVTGSYQFKQQQLKQSDETKATSFQQQMPSLLFALSLLVDLRM